MHTSSNSVQKWLYEHIKFVSMGKMERKMLNFRNQTLNKLAPCVL